MDKTVRIRLALLTAALLSLWARPLAADEPDNLEELQAMSQADRVTLNADRVSYNDETGQASAQGEAVLSYQGMTIRAERIDYDAATQRVEAMPLPGEKVVLSGQGRTLRGDHLDYDLTTQEGILTGARTSLPVGEGGTLYVYGGEIDVLPWDMAVERGLVHGEKSSPGQYLAQWRNVAVTTCALEHAHYRLESKTISFIPGRSVVVKHPRVYLGNTYLLTLPTDYVVSIRRRALRYSVIPYFQHSDERGTGVGFTGTIGWDTGSLSLGLAWADKAGLEGMIELEQELSQEFTLNLGTEYTWDDLWDERQWRPWAALTYGHNGWTAKLLWKKNEYIEDQKDSLYKYKGRLDRQPELSVFSPWYETTGVGLKSWLRVGAFAGSYQETLLGSETNSIGRYGVQVHPYFEKILSPRVELFVNAVGELWFYDRGSSDQEMLWTLSGLRYGFGAFELGTAYEQRWTWSSSPMAWDQYRTRERIHQRVRFPFGREVYFLVRGSWDLQESMVDEMFYDLQWVTDCMKWDLYYKNDRSVGGDSKVGLSISIRAFPNTPASLGQRLERDPFERPEGLKQRYN